MKGIPAGFHTLTPHLTVRGAAEAIEFYRRAFGAVEVKRMEWGELVGHAELRIGDSPLMLNDEFPQHGKLAPPEAGGGVELHLYVEDADASFRQAVEAGASVLMELDDTFWGDRFGVVLDPFGHRWSIATQKEVLSSEEIAERAKQAFGGA